MGARSRAQSEVKNWLTLFPGNFKYACIVAGQTVKLFAISASYDTRKKTTTIFLLARTEAALQQAMCTELKRAMKPCQTLIAFVLSFGLLHSCSAADPLVAESGLTDDEAKLFNRIAKVDPTFHHSNRARRYYRIHPETKEKLPILVELVLPTKNGIYFDEYLTYTVTLDPRTSVVSYTYDAGTANRGKGTILVTPHTVIKVQRGCGVTACITQIFRNGEAIREEEG